MPELPDVEFFKRLIEEHCVGRLIDRVIVTDPESLEGASPASLQRRLKGKHLHSCRRHGKVLFIEVDTAGTLAMHLGTNGSLQYVLHDQQEPPYVRLWLDFVDGDRLAYLNPRRIGHVVLVQSSGAYIADTGLGPDALDPAFDEAAFSTTLGNRKNRLSSRS